MSWSVPMTGARDSFKKHAATGPCLAFCPGEKKKKKRREYEVEKQVNQGFRLKCWN